MSAPGLLALAFRGLRHGVARRLSRRRTDQRGQSLVEMSIIVPFFMLLLSGMLEFGLAFDHQLTLRYATREGARMGAALANGGGTLGCSAGQSPQAGAVDQNIVAAVERVLTATGSPISISNVSEIDIYKAQSSGAVNGTQINVWTYSSSGTATTTSGTLTAPAVHFVQSSVGWSACSRVNAALNGNPVDSIGVRLTYTYRAVTPLAAMLRFFGGPGWSTLPITDYTVMALNPTN